MRCKDWESRYTMATNDRLTREHMYHFFYRRELLFISADPQSESRLELLMPAPPSSGIAVTLESRSDCVNVCMVCSSSFKPAWKT